MIAALLNVLTSAHIVNCGENIRTPHGIARVWPKPGKEPRELIDRAILVAIHHESAFLATIRPLPERHLLDVSTSAAYFGRVALIYKVEILPEQLAFAGEHLNEG